jgi:phosphoribosylformimino-5-aminoimidazole carboxamide ribotide isomerase
VYDADPVETARGFAASGAELLHVVDLDAAFGEADSGNAAVIERIVGEVAIPVEVGGGMRSVEAVRRMIERGAGYAIVGTLAVREPETLAQLVAEFDAKIVVGIDARDGQVMTHGWETGGGIAATELALRVARVGVARIIYTDVARDGMLAGVNLEQTASVARAAGVRVTASGGIGSLADVRRLVEFESAMTGEVSSGGRIDSVIVGKALYENRFTLAEALTVAKGEEK